MENGRDITGRFNSDSGNTGRPKGSETHVKKEARALFMQIMEGQISHVEDALEDVYYKDKAKYIECLSKLMPYFLPKNHQMQIKLNVGKDLEDEKYE